MELAIVVKSLLFRFHFQMLEEELLTARENRYNIHFFNCSIRTNFF